MSLRIGIDRSRPLHEGAPAGHNRWWPQLEPVAACNPGDEVTFEIRDSRDREITRESTHEDLLGVPSLAHPLTGPLEVRGARPGDVLVIEVLGYETDDFAWTAIWPGSGFLGDLFGEPFLAKWEIEAHPAEPGAFARREIEAHPAEPGAFTRREIAGGVARSEQVPGVAVPASTHAGTIGVAPSPELFERALARERALADRGGRVPLPDPEHAWPPEAAGGLRTYPPRENGGNMDIRDLGPGARLWLPVHVEGALLSVGDLHFAQGDGEVCISAIETGGVATFRIGLRSAGSEWRPRFPAYEAPPRPPRRVFATTGIPLDDGGAQGDLDLNLATRRALLELLGWLTSTRGLGREAAYVLMSVAAELRVSELVDAPNALVSAVLPLDVFEG